MIGWKYRILELTPEQVNLFKARSGGRLRFKIINTTGLPVEGSMLETTSRSDSGGGLSEQKRPYTIL